MQTAAENTRAAVAHRPGKLWSVGDDDGFDETDTSHFGGNNTMTTVLNVVTAINTIVQNDTNHVTTIFVIKAHLLDLTEVASEQFAHYSFSHVNIVERNPNGIFVANAGLGLAHDVSFAGASGTSTHTNGMSVCQLGWMRRRCLHQSPYSWIVMGTSFG
jgi:hypothetical protein